MQVQTKVLKPVNVRALAMLRESADELLRKAEDDKDTGEITLTISVRTGGVIGLRSAASKSMQLTEHNA